jgi:hypothetical protein
VFDVRPVSSAADRALAQNLSQSLSRSLSQPLSQSGTPAQIVQIITPQIIAPASAPPRADLMTYRLLGARRILARVICAGTPR